MSADFVALVASTSLVGAAAVAVAWWARRAQRSPRETVRALARRNVPIPQIARRTRLPQDVVQMLLRTPDLQAPTRQQAHPRETSAGSERPPAARNPKLSPPPRVRRVAAPR